FRNQATEDILTLLVRNLRQEFTVTQLRTITGHGGDTVTTALTVLEAADLIGTRREGNKRLISANRDRIQNPADPIARIPQSAFQHPVHAFLETMDDSPVDPVGIVLFGSVARGDADRASDIDLLVIVETDVMTARRELTEIRRTVEQQRFDGDRYAFQLMVEAADSVENYGPKLHEIFSEGIVLRDSERLQELNGVVFDAQ
ncbi:MAG: nucleotidyltransferase domain-containing protein, partial [Halalkalicoccus sp.]|nr:nucleotidyltransferase domain-containing protein [Halalkalicoccus sp.]